MCGLEIIMVSGRSSAMRRATVRYAATVFSICASLPLPTSGIIIGGWGTINAPTIAITVTSPGSAPACVRCVQNLSQGRVYFLSMRLSYTASSSFVPKGSSRSSGCSRKYCSIFIDLEK